MQSEKMGYHDSVMKQFDENDMFTYLTDYSNKRTMPETRKALLFAREMHKNQLRKEGIPYIIHPLTMACNLLALGICNDNVIATVLLHDVCEDCGVSVEELPVNAVVKRAVEAVTFDILEGETRQVAKKRYYDNILNNEEATITKLADRSHNVSSMAQAFSKERLREYIVETREYVLPLLYKAKERYPDLSNALFILKYHICSIVDSVDSVMNLYEKDLGKEKKN